MPVENTTNITPAFHLHTQDEVEDIIGNPPSWILHWGIIIILFLVVIFCSLAGIVKYPDVLSAPVMITTMNPAIRVIPEIGGRAKYLFAKDQELVTKGQALLLLESEADWQDVQLLKKSLNTTDDIFSLNGISRTLLLGNMQSTYTALIQQLDELKYFRQDQSHLTNLTLLQNQMMHYEELNNSISKQSLIFKEEVNIVKHNYEITKQLFDSGAASNLEVETTKLDHLSHQRQLENMESQILNNQISIKQLQAKIELILQTKTSQELALKTAIMKLIRQLNNEIASWEKRYLLKAPVDGILSLERIWSQEQFVEANKPICTIVPKENTGSVIVKAKMPAAGIGKIEIGTKANISLTGYPEQEYGILRSTVQSIGMLPEWEQNNTYLVELSLNNGLKTSYNNSIPLQYEMTGIAEIITEERSILQRIINQSLHFMKNR